MKETSVKENVKEMPKRENTTRNTSPVKTSTETKQFSSEETKHIDRNANAPQKTFNRTDNINADRRPSNHGPRMQENAQSRPQFAQKPNGSNQQGGNYTRPQQRPQQNAQPQQNTPVVPQNNRPIPQPQPQKPKEKKEQQPLAPKTTRIVDTRTTSVDLSKYDE